MFSNEKLSRTALPASEEMFKPERWRNIQEVIKDTLVHFYEAFTGIETRITTIQQTRKTDREDLVKQLLSITTSERAISEKISNMDVDISEQVQRAISKVQPDIECLQSQQQLLLQELSRKITQEDLSRQLKRGSSKKVLKGVPEQELYLESNQTMFGMVVQEISRLKDSQSAIGDTLLKKNKATLALNNEMCSKLQTIEKDITLLKQRQQDHRHKDTKINQENKSKPSSKHRDFYQSLKVTNLSEILTELQKDLHEKAYLKDIMQLIQNNLSPLEESVENMRLYFESNMTSTNKILNHQTVINEELCREMRLARWEWSGTVSPKLSMLPWEKQLINLYPESLLWTKNTASLVVREPGTYLFHITLMGNHHPTVGLVINKAEVRYSQSECNGFSMIYSDVVRVEKNSSVSVYYDGKEGSALLTVKRI